MKALLDAAAALQREFEQRGWRFCCIGGIANFRWGTPRLTNDVDVTLLTGFGNEETFVRALLDVYTSRVPDPIVFAQDNRVVLLRTAEGFGVDVALGAMPFEERTIERSSVATLQPGVALRTCSADDLVVHKAFAGRPQDWVDVEGVLVKQRGLLEWPQIWEELGPLVTLKGEPESLGELRQTIARAERVVGPFAH